MPRALLDGPAAAARLGSTERHLRHLITRREIPFVKDGRLNRFDPDDLDTWVDANRTEAAN